MAIHPFRIFFVISILLLGVWGCSRPQADSSSEMPPRPVKTRLIRFESATETRHYPGVVAPATETRLAFRVGGPLIRFDVKIGQQMRKGDLIAELDPRDYRIQVRRLEANLAEARAFLRAMKAGDRPEDIASLAAEHNAVLSRLNEAQRTYERYERLHEAHAVARATLDHVLTAYDTAKAAAEASEKALEKARKGARAEDIEAMEARILGIATELSDARNRLGDTRLSAPFDGVVYQKFVKNFDTVGSGEPIASFFDSAHPEVSIRVPESVIARLDRIRSVVCTLNLFPDQNFTGEIKEIGIRTEAANQSYPIIVSLTVPEGIDVHPGMAATVSLTFDLDTGEESLFLPLAAITTDAEKGSRVFILDPKTHRIHTTSVTTGVVRDDQIRILQGLRQGDEVVTAGARFLRTGQEVRRLSQEKLVIQ
jgi:multidrug resistance efflux pump